MADRVNVDPELAEILRAIFGKDVRGSIHDGIKAIADGVNKVGNEWDTKVEDGDFQATIDIGKVETGEAGTNAEVSNSGTNHNVVLNFKIPEGIRGIDGKKGDSGVWTGMTEPPEDGDYDVWALPEGTPDYEIEASSIITDDRSNVQAKLDVAAYIDNGIIKDTSGNQYGLTESGTFLNGIGRYYKYADGRSEAFIKFTYSNFSIATTSITNVLQLSDAIPIGNFPNGLFIDTPIANISTNHTNQSCFINTYSGLTEINAGTFRLGKFGSAATDASGAVNVSAFGRWK